jgi:cytochrome c oxidase subunit 4
MTSETAGNRLFAITWIYLLALTAVEVVLAYVHILSTAGMLVVLMCLSLVKAALIMAYFMHLRFERTSFVLALLPAVLIVIGLLSMFFPDSLRLFELGVMQP